MIMDVISKAHDHAQILPENRLQRLAFLKGYRSASAFAVAAQKAGVTSYGTAYAKWNGKAENTKYGALLAIAKFLGASSVEEVFEP